MDWTHFYKKINVALLGPFPACKRAEYTQVRYPMLLANFQDLFTFSSKKFFNLHNYIIQQGISNALGASRG